MRTGCLINHYNYGRFVGEAFESVLAQTRPLDEIVLVDDGSTDGSRDVVLRLGEREPRLKLLLQTNAGQLSCFNAAFAASSADVLFFLDADDLWDPGYVAAALDVFASRPAIDFVACQHARLGPDERVDSPAAGDRDLGYSVLRTIALRRWVGAPTSCLSMRRTLLERFLPLPFTADWRTRADDCLVYGASLAGGRKYFLGRPLVRYRIHGANAYQGVTADPHADYRRRLAVNRLLAHVAAEMGWSPDLDDHAHREFRTIERPTRREFRDYRRIAWRARRPLSRRAAMVLSMAAYYWFGTARG